MKKVLIPMALLYGCAKQVDRVQYVTQSDTVMTTTTVGLFPPSNDSSLVFLAYDTVPGFTLDSIVIEDIQTGIFHNYQPEILIESYVIHPLIPMLGEINIYYRWIEPTPPVFSPIISMYTFNYDHSWIAHPINKIPFDGEHSTVATFSFIDISKIFTIKFINHAD